VFVIGLLFGHIAFYCPAQHIHYVFETSPGAVSHPVEIFDEHEFDKEISKIDENVPVSEIGLMQAAFG
jgi:hypothetical protein